MGGSVEAARLLLNHGASLEAQDAAGQTPIAVAAMHGHEAVEALLRERGANTYRAASPPDSAGPLLAVAMEMIKKKDLSPEQQATVDRISSDGPVADTLKRFRLGKQIDGR